MSTAGPSIAPARRIRLGWMIGLGIVAVLVGANAHLVYVAFSSQPACVSHLKASDGAGHFSAAKSSC